MSEIDPRVIVVEQFTKLLQRVNGTYKKYKRYGKKKLKTTAQNIEKGLYNRTIEEAAVQNILKKWENNIFKNLYKAIGFTGVYQSRRKLICFQWKFM